MVRILEKQAITPVSETEARFQMQELKDYLWGRMIPEVAFDVRLKGKDYIIVASIEPAHGLREEQAKVIRNISKHNGVEVEIYIDPRCGYCLEKRFSFDSAYFGSESSGLPRRIDED